VDGETHRFMRVVRLCILFVAMIADGWNSGDAREGGEYGLRCCGGVLGEIGEGSHSRKTGNRGFRDTSSMGTRWRE
jgi:hypothetical protein